MKRLRVPPLDQKSKDYPRGVVFRVGLYTGMCIISLIAVALSIKERFIIFSVRSSCGPINDRNNDYGLFQEHDFRAVTFNFLVFEDYLEFYQTSLILGTDHVIVFSG